MKRYIKSNCKINLKLKIKGIKDNYHLLESIFCPINLYDEMTFEESDKDEVVGMNIPLNDNIIYKTIVKFKERYNINRNIKVTIKKNIPMQAGLGGGSSNAAFTIRMLNEIFNLDLSIIEMIDFGKTIGSDVPFFIINKPSLVEGRGEIVKEIKEFSKVYGILVFDDIFMSTKEVFEIYDTIDKKQNTINLDNDLELVLDSINEGNKVKEIKNELSNLGCYKVLMSGAGGSVFGLCDKDEINRIYNSVKVKYKNVWMFESI